MAETNPEEKAGAQAASSAPPKKAKRRKALVAVLAVAAIAVGAFAAWQAFAPQDAWYDPEAVTGHYEGKSEEEIVADLNRQVEEGMMNISIAGTLESADGDTATARIENIEANGKDQKVEIALDETGEVIYESGAIAPGQYVQDIDLARHFDPGVYDVTATFTSYDLDTHAEAGEAAAQVQLVVAEQ